MHTVCVLVLQEKLLQIQGRVQQLVALLTACAATTLHVSSESAVDDLLNQASLQHSNSPQVVEHLEGVSLLSS